MKTFKIQSTSNETLFEGLYPSLIHCLEDAILKRKTLAQANLRAKNLSNINLDDAVLPEADFTNANLSGANISESYLHGAKFDGAALFNACFAYSNLGQCNFQNASFGATDISGAILDGSEFSTLSCFSLDFITARQMQNCAFISRDGNISRLSKPPLVIRGYAHTPIIIMDDTIHAGHNRINHHRSRKLAEKITMKEIRKRLNTKG